jgi:hypothetical protein
VLLTVAWDEVGIGHRFAHTAIPDSHPLHSEAINYLEAAPMSTVHIGDALVVGEGEPTCMTS